VHVRCGAAGGHSIRCARAARRRRVGGRGLRELCCVGACGALMDGTNGVFSQQVCCKRTSRKKEVRCKSALCDLKLAMNVVRTTRLSACLPACLSVCHTLRMAHKTLHSTLVFFRVQASGTARVEARRHGVRIEPRAAADGTQSDDAESEPDEEGAGMQRTEVRQGGETAHENGDGSRQGNAQPLYCSILRPASRKHICDLYATTSSLGGRVIYNYISS
jgi:hypothetical protein